MKYLPNIRGFFSNHIYLLLLAAWFLTLAVIIETYWSPNSSAKGVQKKISTYINDAENEFRLLVSEQGFIEKVTDAGYDADLINILARKKYFLFVYKNDTSSSPRLLFWNTQQVLPTAALPELRESHGLVLLQNGYYVWNNFTKGDVTALLLIPVKWNYIITNEYLQNGFALPDISEEYDITFERGKGVGVKSVYGKQLFSILKKFDSPTVNNNLIAVVLGIISVILILFFIHIVASKMALENVLKGIGFFMISVILIRVGSYFLPAPFNFRQFELFDPVVYGSNDIQRSLGDLLINSLLFVWFIFFLRTHLKEDLLYKWKNSQWKWLLMFTGCLLIVLTTFTCSNIIRSLITDSQISFEVINFFTLNIYSVIGFAVLSCIAIGYYFLGQMIVVMLHPLFPKKPSFRFYSQLPY